MHLLNDAWLNAYDCAVLVSNDSDLAEPLRLIKSQLHKKIELIFPNEDKKRKPSRQLAQYADFIKRIKQGVLKNSQLPTNIPGTSISKPAAW